MTMNVKKQQMQLQLQLQPQRRQNRTGFESLLDQPSAATSVDGVGCPQNHVVLLHHHYEHRAGSTAAQSGSGAAVDSGDVDAETAYSPVPVATPTSPSQLSLPSPYYDRNPIIGFQSHHRQQQHHQYSPKSPITVVPLANVQNVVGDQDTGNHSSKVSYNYFY